MPGYVAVDTVEFQDRSDGRTRVLTNTWFHERARPRELQIRGACRSSGSTPDSCSVMAAFSEDTAARPSKTRSAATQSK